MKAPSLMSVLICLAVTAAILSAQSLAEIAEQEKKRREKLPPSKVVRDQDLAASRASASVSEMGDGQSATFSPATLVVMVPVEYVSEG